jgi:hypothetical protein
VYEPGTVALHPVAPASGTEDDSFTSHCATFVLPDKVKLTVSELVGSALVSVKELITGRFPGSLKLTAIDLEALMLPAASRAHAYTVFTPEPAETVKSEGLAAVHPPSPIAGVVALSLMSQALMSALPDKAKVTTGLFVGEELVKS